MSPDDTTDDASEDSPEETDVENESGNAVEVTVGDDESVRERLEEEADRAVEGFDDRFVDLLAWVLETETRARIYVSLRQQPHSTSEEIAEATGLYPSTVREALAELHDEEKVTRQKRESDGAGNNPYEYSAMAPSDLVSDVVDEVQDQLNTVFNLDSYLNADESEADEPVTISVEDVSDSDDDPADEAGEE